MILALFPVLIFRLLLLDDRKGGTKDTRFEIQKLWVISYILVGLQLRASYDLVQRQQ